MSLTGSIDIIPVTDINYGINPDSVKIFEQKTNSLNLLLFSVGGVSFGVDADQVAEITAYKGEKAEDLFWFHEEMGYGNRPVSYHTPVIVALKFGQSGVHKVIIDAMEDIAEFRLDNINILPPLLEPFTLNYGYWGVLQRSGKMVLLLDFDLKLKGNAIF